MRCELWALHSDGSDYSQTFDTAPEAMACRQRLFAEGWMAVGIEPQKIEETTP
jgi:hypothetical protein